MYPHASNSPMKGYLDVLSKQGLPGMNAGNSAFTPPFYPWGIVHCGNARQGTKGFLNVSDEVMHECLASIPRRNWKSKDVIELLSGLMVERGCPKYIRSDNGPEFIAN